MLHWLGNGVVCKETAAMADLVGSAAVWAVTVTVCDVRILDGAVYRPAEEIVPTDGLIDQVIAVLLVPKTVAVNCCVPEGAKLTVDGLRDTVTARRSVISAVTVFEGSATLAAVTVTLWVVGAVLGAT
jgi:hypothetical protein